MLLEGYRKEIFRPMCNNSFESLHCHAHLDQDIVEALPYLNAQLGAFEYSTDPPSLTLRTQGKIIAVHPRLIAVNALKDEDEADKILRWLQNEINDAWENRHGIQPSTESAPRPKLLEILKLLPKTNCRQCGQPTCMVFAAQAMEGGKWAANCPAIDPAKGRLLDQYLAGFFGE